MDKIKDCRTNNILQYPHKNNRSSEQRELFKRLIQVIGEYSEGLPMVSVIGILEVVKYDLIERHREK